jgi:excisionase family DNA binding protein
MANRRHNHRLVKTHRTYTVVEAARLLGAHAHTVRNWIRTGLPVIEGRPVLIHGRDLAAFLKARRAAKRRTLAPGQIYCVRCREARQPAGGMAEYALSPTGAANLAGICPVCDSMIYRRFSLRNLELIRGILTVTLAGRSRDITERSSVSGNCAFEEASTSNA